MWRIVLVLLIFIVSFMWKPEIEKYEQMGVYGTRRTLDPSIPGELQILPPNTGLEESPSLTETQLAQIQGNAVEGLLHWDNQYHLLPTHQVDVS